MIRHLNILIILCSLALAVCVLGTLYYTVRGKFSFMAGGAVATLLFFSLLVVLLKERRVARIMHEDDYDEKHDAV